MASEIKAADVIKNYKRKRVVPLPECQLGWCVVECVEVDAEDLKSDTGMLFLPTGKEEVLASAKGTPPKPEGVVRFFVRKTAPQFQCNATTIVDTPFEVGDEVLIEVGAHVRVRTERVPYVLPEKHMMVRIENISAWQKCKMDESRKAQS